MAPAEEEGSDSADSDSEEDLEDGTLTPEPRPYCQTFAQHAYDISIDKRIIVLKSELQWDRMEPAAQAAARAAAIPAAKKRIRRSLGLSLTASDATVEKAWRKFETGISYRENQDQPIFMFDEGEYGQVDVRGGWFTRRMFLLVDGAQRSDPALSEDESVQEAELLAMAEQDGEAVAARKQAAADAAAAAARADEAAGKRLRDQAAAVADDDDIAEALGTLLVTDDEAGGDLDDAASGADDPATNHLSDSDAGAEPDTPEGSLSSVKVSHGASKGKLTAKEKRRAKKYANRTQKRTEANKEKRKGGFVRRNRRRPREAWLRSRCPMVRRRGSGLGFEV